MHANQKKLILEAGRMFAIERSEREPGVTITVWYAESTGRTYVRAPDDEEKMGVLPLPDDAVKKFEALAGRSP
jgi:hypothetical protein